MNEWRKALQAMEKGLMPTEQVVEKKPKPKKKTSRFDNDNRSFANNKKDQEESKKPSNYHAQSRGPKQYLGMSQAEAFASMKKNRPEPNITAELDMIDELNNEFLSQTKSSVGPSMAGMAQGRMMGNMNTMMNRNRSNEMNEYGGGVGGGGRGSDRYSPSHEYEHGMVDNLSSMLGGETSDASRDIMERIRAKEAEIRRNYEERKNVQRSLERMQQSDRGHEQQMNQGGRGSNRDSMWSGSLAENDAASQALDNQVFNNPNVFSKGVGNEKPKRARKTLLGAGPDSGQGAFNKTGFNKMTKMDNMDKMRDSGSMDSMNKARMDQMGDSMGNMNMGNMDQTSNMGNMGMSNMDQTNNMGNIGNRDQIRAMMEKMGMGNISDVALIQFASALAAKNRMEGGMADGMMSGGMSGESGGGMSGGMGGGTSGGMSGGLGGGKSGGMAGGMAGGMSGGMAGGLSGGMGGGMSGGSSYGMGDGMADGSNYGMGGGIGDGMAGGSSYGKGSGMTGGSKYGLGGGMGDGMTGGSSYGMGGGMGDGMAGGSSYGMGGGMAGGSSYGMAGGTSYGISDGMAGGTSYGMGGRMVDGDHAASKDKDLNNRFKEGIKSLGPRKEESIKNFNWRCFIASDYDGISSQFLRCPDCNIRVDDADSFIRHIHGIKHKNMMIDLERKSKMMAKEYKREVEYLENVKDEKKAEYCGLCDCKVNGIISSHRGKYPHKALKSYIHPFCSFCAKEYDSRPEFQVHRFHPQHLWYLQKENISFTESQNIKSDEEFMEALRQMKETNQQIRTHRKGKEEERKKNEKERDKRRSRDRSGDRSRDRRDRSRDREDRNRDRSKDRRDRSRDREDRNRDGDDRSRDRRRESTAKEDREKEKPKVDKRDNESVAKKDDKKKDDQKKDTENSDQGDADEVVVIDVEEDKKPVNPLDAVEPGNLETYDESKGVGREFLRPVTGFFCRACKKLLPTEEDSAAHIKSKVHWDACVKADKNPTQAKKRPAAKTSSNESPAAKKAATDEEKATDKEK